MSYKNIKSMLHNFGHSFCSLMNYIDDEYIIDIIPKIVKNAENKIFIIDFPSSKYYGISEIPEKLKKSVRHWGNWLPNHINSHKIEAKKVKNVRIKFSPSSHFSHHFNNGFECDVICEDDRGKEYKVRVNQKI